MDKALAIVPLRSAEDADTFVNVEPPWLPPWGRGIFGGSLIGQSLCAAQTTVASQFHAHSMHCYFLRPGIADEPFVYYVSRLHDGKRFKTRTVHARQRGRDIFCATISFTYGDRALSPPQGPKRELVHEVPMPSGILPPPRNLASAIQENMVSLSKAAPAGDDRPYDCIRCGPPAPGPPEQRKFRHWIRARFTGTASSSSASRRPQDHLAALAYMSDGYYIGTVARAHGARRFSDAMYIERMVEHLGGKPNEKAWRREVFRELAQEEQADIEGSQNGSVKESGVHVGMMATLHHTIFFHQWSGLETDQWMLAEMDSPWAGDERGLVTQRIWSQSGKLIATCVQEGVVRLSPEASKEGRARM